MNKYGLLIIIIQCFLQVVSAPAAEREDLLMELQQFAFRGIPNASGMGKHAVGQV